MKKLMAILICLSMGLLVVGTANAVPVELLTNGGFEMYGGSLWAWQPWNLGNVGVTGDTWYEGVKASIIHWDGGAEQVVDVFGGGTYVAQGAAYIGSGGDPISWGTYISVDWLNSLGQKILNQSWGVDPKDVVRDEWRSYNSGDLIAPSAAVKARIGYGTYASPGINPVAPTYYDAFSFVGEPVPEPASILLLGTGLVGLFSFGRKRKK